MRTKSCDDGGVRSNLAAQAVGNRLLAALPAPDRALLEPHAVVVDLRRHEVLFEPGDDIVMTHFPGAGTMVSLVVPMEDGRTVEAATIGREGAVGGIVSSGHKPAFARGIVQIEGPAVCIETVRLEDAKQRSPRLRDLFARYSDALLAQVLQSVACNALHTLESRCARWLLTTQDRVGSNELMLTQEFLAEMLGVQRTTVTGVAQSLQAKGYLNYRRGRVTILNRAGLERIACECYKSVEDHFARVMPEAVDKAATEETA